MATKLRMGAKGRSSFAAARMMGDERCTDGVREKANASVVAEDANTKKTTGGEQRMVEELRKRARLLLGEGGSVVVCCVSEVSKCQLGSKSSSGRRPLRKEGVQ